MPRKKRGNDAIPTWSGFNYQGKITLLCSLIEINKLIANGYTRNLLDNCYVEIEKTEDFVFFLYGQVKSLYQVKAYLSNNRVSVFFEAMQKLIDHRNDLGTLNADCYLCTPLPICNWNDKSNRYKKQIQLFFYDNAPVYLTQVPEKIKCEIEKVQKNIGLTNRITEDIYLGLCNLLEEKVADIHNQEPQKKNYNLYFNDIVDYINDSYTNYTVEVEAVQKEKIYNHIIANFKNVIDDFCNNDCDNKKMGTCKKDIYGVCALTTSYDYILEINIWEYCKYLNPHIITDWDNQLRYIERLREEDIKKLLVPIFYKISDNTLYSNDKTIYCETDMFNTVENKVIPTLLTFDSGYNDITKSSSSILDRIKKNSFLSHSSMAGCTITADTKGDQYNTEENSILYFDQEENYNITNNDNYIKIVDGREFIQRMEE